MKLIYDGLYYDCLFNGLQFVIHNKVLGHDEVFLETLPSALNQCRAMNSVLDEFVRSEDPRLVLWD